MTQSHSQIRLRFGHTARGLIEQYKTRVLFMIDIADKSLADPDHPHLRYQTCNCPNCTGLAALYNPVVCHNGLPGKAREKRVYVYNDSTSSSFRPPHTKAFIPYSVLTLLTFLCEMIFMSVAVWRTCGWPARHKGADKPRGCISKLP